jgi:transcriptional regulator with XRE-family HTH domain
MTTFGERVKHERDRRRYSQNELATQVGISQALLSKIEAGKSPAPGGEVVKRLARALWVSTDYLLGMDDESEHVAPMAS